MCLGISKISTPYTVGEKTIDVMLDILNLDKRESVSVQGISNQEFTEVIKLTLLIENDSFVDLWFTWLV